MPKLGMHIGSPVCHFMDHVGGVSSVRVNGSALHTSRATAYKFCYPSEYVTKVGSETTNSPDPFMIALSNSIYKTKPLINLLTI